MNSEPAQEYQAQISNNTVVIFQKTESATNMSEPFDESKPGMRMLPSPQQSKPMPSEPDDFDRFAKN
jgi:hypothetical protein